MQELLESASGIAHEAGRRILPFFQDNCAHRLKADSSPVSEADLASHEFLVEALGKLSPGLKVVSEEGANSARSGSASGDYWLIDPLDGTKEFLKGKPEFTVNLALMREARPILGVVYAPAKDLIYAAQLGAGAWRQAGRGPRSPIQTRRAELNRLTVVASKDHSGPRVKRMLEQLHLPSLTSIGSSLKFCLVAEGTADLYFRDVPTMEWDTAAAQCVLEAAGGAVFELNGQPLRYGKADLRNGPFMALGDPTFAWQHLTGEP